MTGVRQWAFSLCVAMVACGIARMILPKSNLQKIFNLTLSVFILCCMLSPVILQNPGLRLEAREYSQTEIERRARSLTDMVDYQSKTAASAGLEKIITEKLSQMGIKYRSVTININTNGQNGARVESVDIVLEKQHEGVHAAILRELENSTGLKIHLGYE